MSFTQKAIMALVLQACVVAENAIHSSDTLGINKLSGVTKAGFRKKHFASLTNRSIFSGLPSLGMHKLRGLKLPDSVDWREQGAVTDVKNQDQCATCWAFAATGAIEGAWKIASGNLISLSEQQLQDCSGSKNTECHSTTGGFADNAFNSVKETGLCTEDSYPFTGENGTCQAQCTYGLTQGQLTGYVDVQPNDEGALMDAVVQQPVAVWLHSKVLDNYQPGTIVQGTCPEGEDDAHAVLIVGYGTDAGMDYWLVKNSWGTNWGDSGYFRMQRGVGGSGECSIAANPSYPSVSVRAFEGDAIVV